MWCMKKEGMKESREDYLETILVLNRKSPDEVQTGGCGKSSGNHQAKRDKGHDRAGKGGAYQKKRKRTSASYGVRP